MFNSLDPSILTRLPATSIYPRFVSAVTARLFASDSSSSFKPSDVIRHIPSSLSSSSSSVFPESSFSLSTNLWCLSLHSHQTLSDTVWWIWYQRLISEYLLCTLWVAGMSHPLFSSTSLLDRMLLSLSICLLYQTSSYSCALVLRNILVATRFALLQYQTNVRFVYRPLPSNEVVLCLTLVLCWQLFDTHFSKYGIASQFSRSLTKRDVELLTAVTIWCVMMLISWCLLIFAIKRRHLMLLPPQNTFDIRIWLPTRRTRFLWE